MHARCPDCISWFYRADYGAGYILVANALSSLLILLLLLPEIRPGFRARPSAQRLRQMLPYVFPVLLLGLAGIFNQNADKILFPFLFDDRDCAEAQLGIYGACFKIAVVMVMFIQAFRYAYEPFIFAREKERDSRTANAVVMKYFIMFALALFLGVMFYLDVIKYFVVPSYYAGLKVVPVVMLGELFAGVYFNLSVWYKLTDRTVWGARFAAVGCAVTVAMIILCVPKWGFMACAWALFTSNFLMMLLSYVVGQRHYRVKYDLRSAAAYTLLAGGLYLAGMWPEFGHPVVQLLYRTFLLALYIIYMVRRDLWPAYKRRTSRGL
jgi:O-antigen/teichoic acid export membrane protein